MRIGTQVLNMRKGKSKMRNKKLFSILLSCLIIATLSSSLSAGVRSDTTLITRSNASRFLTGGFASGSYSTNNQGPENGYFSVSCSGNSQNCVYAYAVSGDSYTGQSGNKVMQIYVQVKSNTGYSGNGNHKIYLAFVDSTTGQTIYQSTSSNWNEFTGALDISANPTVYMTNGHYYELQCGPYVQTTGTQSAQAYGTIELLQVTYN